MFVALSTHAGIRAMWEGYKTTKAEHRALEKAMRDLEHWFPNEWTRIAKCVRDEHHGYGMSTDRLPLDGARGLVCKWFADGVADRDRLLRDSYDTRPAAIYMMGLGADRFDKTETDLMVSVWRAIEAHEAAFARMHNANVAALRNATREG